MLRADANRRVSCCRALCALILTLFSVTAWSAAQDSLEVSGQLPRVNLVPYIDHLVDASGELAIEDVTGSRSQGFSAFQGDSINIGYTPDAHWFRFTVSNPSERPVLVFLEIGFPLLDNLQLFERSEDAFQQLQMGDLLPFNERPVKVNEFAVPLTVEAEAEQTYYLRVETKGTVFLPMHLASPVAYVEQVHQHQWVLGILYGVLVGLFMYNTFLFLSVREPIYLYYVAYIVFSIGWLSGVDGANYRVFPNSVVWQQYSTFICGNLAAIFLFLFTREQLELRKAGVWMQRVAHGVIGVNLFAIVLHGFLDIRYTGQIAVFIGLISLMIAFALGVVRLFQGFVAARWFVFAFIAFVGCGALAMLSFFAVIPGLLLALYGMKISLVLKLTLLSLSLGDRINQSKEREFTLEREAIQATAHSKATSDFLAKMSHEIRTPMNGVLGIAQLMSDTPLNRMQKQFLDVIQNSGRALLSIINDILDFSKIEAGKMELEDIGYNLEEVLNDCVSIFSFQASEKNLELVLSIAPDAPIVLKGDPTRLRQVMLNLQSNALKFTEKGGIVVRVEPVRDEQGEVLPEVRIEVRDSGIGMSESARAKLFQSFVQADSTTTRKYGGTGLGLAISKQLVELMHGQIGVDSVEGEGTTFWLQIPVRKPAEDEMPKPYLPVDLGDCSVFIVDCKQAFCKAMEEELPGLGIKVDVASSGDVAESQIEKAYHEGHQYDVVLVANQLPEMSGLDFARTVRGRYLHENSKMILMAGIHDVGEGDLLKYSDFDAVIGNPLSSAQLRGAIDHVQNPEHAAPTTKVDPESNKFGDYSHLKVLIAEDNEVNIMVIRGLLRKFKIEPDTVVNGEEAFNAVTSGRTKYDLVLMDCEMPVWDGYKATKEIRDWEAVRDRSPVCILALSAHVMVEMQRRSLDSGMNDHIGKPVQTELLAQKLEQWVGPPGGS